MRKIEWSLVVDTVAHTPIKPAGKKGLWKCTRKTKKRKVYVLFRMDAKQDKIIVINAKKTER